MRPLLPIGFAELTVLLLLALSACSGWDDDSAYAIRTRAAFFLAPDTATGGMTLIQYKDGTLTPAWNASAPGLPTADLSDAAMVDNTLWLASGPRKALYEVEPEDGHVLQTFSGLPIAPHRIAVGRDQVLLLDTAANAFAFVRRRNGDVVLPTPVGDFDLCYYANGRFYISLPIDTAQRTDLHIYDEKALAPRAVLGFPGHMEEIHRNSVRNLPVVYRDTTGRNTAIVSGNADYAEDGYRVTHTKIRYTDWFTARFGTEYTRDLQQVGTQLQTTLLDPLLDSIDNFEADFFEGIAFCTWRDTLLRYSLAKDSVLSRHPFPWDIQKAFYQYGGEE